MSRIQQPSLTADPNDAELEDLGKWIRNLKEGGAEIAVIRGEDDIKAIESLTSNSTELEIGKEIYFLTQAGYIIALRKEGKLTAFELKVKTH